MARTWRAPNVDAFEEWLAQHPVWGIVLVFAALILNAVVFIFSFPTQ